MPKFVTVTPNPALDRTYLLSSFAPNDVNRADSVTVSSGGKGINVARALKTLRSGVVATGFLGGQTGEKLRSLLNKEEIKHDFLDISPCETRLAIICVDRSTGKQTVVNEPGASLSDSHVQKFVPVLMGLADGADGVIFSGSLPPGISLKRYRALIESAKKAVGLVLLDATGDLLDECIEAKPSVLKINRNEALSLGVNIKDWQTGAPSAAEYIRNNFHLQYVAITDGGRGAVLAGPQGTVTAQMPEITVASAVGSGDSFAAGLMHALVSIPDDLPGALRLAAACGGANAMTDSPGEFTPDQIVSLSGRIKIG